MKRISTYKLQLVREKTDLYETKKIISPLDAQQLFLEVFSLDQEPEEVLVMFTLNTKNEITGSFEISRGSLNSSIVHPREIYKRALLNNAASIIIAHNHPSGDPAPSEEDRNITRRLNECGKLLGIELVDHIVLGLQGRYASLKELGLI